MTEIEYKIVVKLMIEKLERLKDEIAEKDAEIASLKENNKAIMHTIAGVHTEAIKEFAGRLKGKFIGITVTNFSIKEIIDNLVKEMVGGNK